MKNELFVIAGEVAKQCINQIKNRLRATSGMIVQESRVEDFLITEKLRIREEYVQIMREEEREYVKVIFLKLAEYDYNAGLMWLHIVSGGRCLDSRSKLPESRD